jgi:multidrug efflux pump subunit AcrA (membrane-fusion protein)
MNQRPAFHVPKLVAVLLASLLIVAGCGREAPKSAEKGPVAVTVLTAERKDVPITAIYVAQTQSSQGVNIQARVSGWLDKRMYVEGSVVKAGQVLFQMDQKPFQAQLDGQQAALQRNQAALQVATQNLARTKPRAVAEGPGRRAGPVPAGRRRGRTGKGASRNGAAQPFVHDDPLAGGRRIELRPRRRRDILEPGQFAADDRLGADADVDQLQRLRKRVGAHPQ